jgi:hypothetical protein
MSLNLRRWVFALVAVLLVGESWAQSWQSTVNVSMCTWADARGEFSSALKYVGGSTKLTVAVNTIRDTVYLDGGALWWQM